MDDAFLDLVGEEDLDGWGPACDRDLASSDPFEARVSEQWFAGYVAKEAGVWAASSSSVQGASGDGAVASVTTLRRGSTATSDRLKQMRALIESAQDPRRREDCAGLCAADWSRSLEQLGAATPQAKHSERPLLRKYGTGGMRRAKMHSQRCVATGDG